MQKETGKQQQGNKPQGTNQQGGRQANPMPSARRPNQPDDRQEKGKGDMNLDDNEE